MISVPNFPGERERMHQEERFSEVLNRFFARHHFSMPALAKEADIPPATLGKWLRDEVARPRHWQDVVKVAAVLRLTEVETNELLKAGRLPTVTQLWENAQTEVDKKVLSPWPQRTPSILDRQ